MGRKTRRLFKAMFGARLERGGPAAGADGRMLAEDGGTKLLDSRSDICCLLEKQELEREQPLG